VRITGDHGNTEADVVDGTNCPALREDGLPLVDGTDAREC
jgi:hypothetical protein